MGDLEIGHWNFWVVFGQIFGFFGFTVYINPTKKYDQLLWCFFLAFVFFGWNFWMRPPLGAVWWWKRWGKAVLVEQYLQVNMTKPQKCIYFFSEIRDPSKSSCICIKFDPHPHKSGKLIEWPFWNHGGKSSEWKMYDIDGAGKGATLKVYCINQCFSWEMLQAPASWKLYHSSAGEYLVKPPHYLQKWHISNYQNLSY